MRQKPGLNTEIKAKAPLWKIALIFLLPALIYLPGILGKIPYPSESALYTDLMLTHYPNALYLQHSIVEFQQIPLWSSLIHSGAPFAANPLAGLFYLPSWFALLFPLPEGISIILAAHAIFGSWGMYRFLKKENVREIGAITGGLIFGLMPKLSAHYGAGHVSLIYAISLTPWLFLISKRDQRGWKTGIIAAFLFLADPRWAVYAGIFWLSYDIAHRHIQGLKSYSLYYLKAGITALLIASPLILPMYEYVRLSTRSRMGVEDIQAFSFSPGKIIGLIIPTSGGNPEWYIYSGGIVLGLFLLQLLIKDLRKRNRFWNFWILTGFLLSFGAWLINPAWLVKLPIISLLRVPARALFLLGFSFSVIAAKTLDELTSKDLEQKNISKISFGLALFSLAMGISIIYILDNFSITAIWGFGFLLIFSIYMLLSKPVDVTRKWTWVVIGLLVIDLLGAGAQSYYAKNYEKLYNSEILDIIKEDPETFRIYSPSYSVPQYLAAQNNLEQADGVDPMQIATYSDFMAEASGVDSPGYSVTIPAFKSGNPAVDNINTIPDSFLLSLLNVKYVISGFEINDSDLQEINTNDKLYLYRNSYLSKRAWVEEVPKTTGNYQNQDHGNIKDMNISPNRISISVNGPGRLVISEIYYPGWKVTVDGDQQTVERAYGLLRSVNLTDGEHKVEFSFQPLTVYGGIGLSIVGWLLAAWQLYKTKNDGILN